MSAGYGADAVLHGIDLSLPPGRLVALLGENGSGKSTLLKLLAGLIRPLDGQLLLDGRPLASLARGEVARAVGYLPQSFEPFFPSTGLELALLGRTPWLGPLGTPRERDRIAALRALSETDATAFAERDVREVSGGERQRILLARVLAGEAGVLLLDEPTANLDPRHRFLVVEALRRRASGDGLVVLSTHELDVAASCDEAVLLRDGRVLGAGPARETLTAPLMSELFGVEAHVDECEGRLRVSLAPRG